MGFFMLSAYILQFGPEVPHKCTSMVHVLYVNVSAKDAVKAQKEKGKRSFG